MDGTTTRSSDVLVKTIMTTDIVTATEDLPVEDAARELTHHRLSGMPVLDGAGRVVGFVSEYDIISKRGRTVGDVMSRGVISVAEDADAAQVATRMGMHGIRLVPVLRDGTLVGIVGRADLVRLFAALRWVCAGCEADARGFAPPERCDACGATTFHLERVPEPA